MAKTVHEAPWADDALTPGRFRLAFLTALKNRGTTLAEVSRGTGISQEQLKKLSQREGQSAKAEDAVRIARYFGVSVETFLGVKASLSASSDETATNLNTMSADEKAILKAFRSLPEERRRGWLDMVDVLLRWQPRT